ncbi:MAG: hypothetical protein RLZZ106_832 [Cyanobacteriota bacterium]|jgi:hypothetical protein
MDVRDLDLAGCTPVNHLWGELVERLGLERSTRAVQQALDLQAMRGSDSSLPVVLVETCGMALIERGALRRATGLPWPEGPGALLLISCPRQELQVLQQER